MVMNTLSIARLSALAIALLLPAGAAAAPDVPAIAAASDLKFALDEAARIFGAETGRSVRPVYGSSGNFMQQIQHGAPFELFMSADESLVFELARRGLTVDDGSIYAVGRIVLFAPNNSPLQPRGGLAEVGRALADGRLRRLAIANPDHAPYGRAARAALQRAGLWDALQPHLVMGENVSQAAQFAALGSVEAGIFALSLALAPAIARSGHYLILPEDALEPLRQRMVLIRGAGETARAFYAWLAGASGHAVLKRYGFGLPPG